MSANFAVCVRKCRKDGLWPVYIRLTLNRQVAYLKTDKLVTSEHVSSGGRVSDRYVLNHCQSLIDRYCKLLNEMDLSGRSASEVRDLLKKPLVMDNSFTDFANEYIDTKLEPKSPGNAMMYRSALHSFSRAVGKDDLKFSDVTARGVKFWIESLKHTKRAKEQYPICVRQIWKNARKHFSEMYDESGVNVLPDVWVNVAIPKSEGANRQPLSAEECRVFFSSPVPEVSHRCESVKMSRDVAMMILCLAGINTADLYYMRKDNFRNGRFCYNRRKTAGRRSDRAYIEIEVPEIVRPVIEEYMAADDADEFFVFSSRYKTANYFNFCVNIGLRRMCNSIAGLRDVYTTYMFRHTWATTAQNDCGASLADVGFALNHMDGHKVTRGYVKLDFSRIWRLNEKVIDFIFFSDAPSRLGGRNDEPESTGRGSVFSVSPRVMIRAAAFFRGKRLADFEDMGYADVEEVISALAAMLPDDIPQRSMVQFKIVDLDSERVAMYERMKGETF